MSVSATIKLSQSLQEIAALLDKRIEAAAGERIAFTLIVFTDGRASYISTCSRADSVQGMRELLKLWDQGMPDIKAHELNS